MKKIVFMILLMSFYGITAIGQEQPQNKELEGKIKVEVDGLSCPFCAYGLEKKLKDMEGVVNIEIDVENAFVLLTAEAGKTLNEEMIRKRVKDAGFTAREIKTVPSDD